ncbi:KamA family protein [bacterium]|nr:KamA family protein [bacterium]
MLTLEDLDKIAINAKCHKLVYKIMKENPVLEEILMNAENEVEVLEGIRHWVMKSLKKSPHALNYYKHQVSGIEALRKLKWNEIAAIRILDYIDNAGIIVDDWNFRLQKTYSNPIILLWLGVKKGIGGSKNYFFEDMLYLFRQFSGKTKPLKINKEILEEWMERYPSGLDPRIAKLRLENRERIIDKFINKIDNGIKRDPKYKFNAKMTLEQKREKMREWWDDQLFHLRFAIRNPDDLNEMLDYSIDPDHMKTLYAAEKAGIPFFINPYFLSLLYVRVPYFAIGGDQAIRDYVLYTRQLVDEFGQIKAWEKEDTVEEGKPNAAGWLIPGHNIHRRYPEVAILIPDTVGRACGGLCSACQRMYGFQNGKLNFNLEKLKPKDTWKSRLKNLMEYFEKDSQLKDILVTGGDALMSSDKSLREILNAIYEMAKRKKQANRKRKPGEKYAELIRVRLGTKLPVYLPQRITPELVSILKEFKEKASVIGIKQFVIQTHFESPLEVTLEARKGVERLLSAGWLVTNQLVYTTAVSKRGHTAKLRQVLNDIGVLPYYTFSVKGYMENFHHFATNARAVQEQMEEKHFGTMPAKYDDLVKSFPEDTNNVVKKINRIREEANLPFLAMDRSVINLPGVGKSLTYRVIGITRYGRRILEFDHDKTRNHSPIIEKMGKVRIAESKAVGDYLRQLEEMGEDPMDYDSIFGYSIGETEDRTALYEYPQYDFEVTNEITNLEIPEDQQN